MNIAFCINRLALIGLGVTVSSLIRNCSDSGNLSLWFLAMDLNLEDKENIVQLLEKENFKGKHLILDFNPNSEFGEFNSLHGDWTTYGKFLLPEIINEERVLYLDADLVVELDVLDAEEVDLKGYAIGAKYGSMLKFALDGAFITKAFGLPPESDYFNAGILLFNLQMWRSEKIKDFCLSLARKYPNELVSHDQTILNAAFSGSFARLPENYNCAWNANGQKPQVAQKMIIHYAGSPKPWDIGGKIIHAGYNTWIKYLDSDWSKSYYRITSKSLKRLWKIRRSYVRWFIKKIKR
jgi:lipopolysaccharide biosynthesis glycosyltransferase